MGRTRSCSAGPCAGTSAGASAGAGAISARAARRVAMRHRWDDLSRARIRLPISARLRSAPISLGPHSGHAAPISARRRVVRDTRPRGRTPGLQLPLPTGRAARRGKLLSLGPRAELQDLVPVAPELAGGRRRGGAELQDLVPVLPRSQGRAELQDGVRQIRNVQTPSMVPKLTRPAKMGTGTRHQVLPAGAAFFGFPPPRARDPKIENLPENQAPKYCASVAPGRWVRLRQFPLCHFSDG